MPFLSPDRVSTDIMNAILTETESVTIQWWVKLMFIPEFFLTPTTFDMLCEALGFGEAMKNFIGRKDQILSQKSKVSITQNGG